MAADGIVDGDGAVFAGGVGKEFDEEGVLGGIGVGGDGEIGWYGGLWDACIGEGIGVEGELAEGGDVVVGGEMELGIVAVEEVLVGGILGIVPGGSVGVFESFVEVVIVGIGDEIIG